MPSIASVSEEATRRKLEKQHREQMDACRKQLETAENRLRESLILKKTLYHDYECQGKELKLQQRKNSDLMDENKKLQSKLDAMIRLGGSVNTTKDKESVTPLPSSVAALTQQMKRAKESLLKYEQQCDIYKEREAEFIERISSLEESLLHTKKYGHSTDDRNQGDLSNAMNSMAILDSREHVELLSKMASLRGEVAAMRTELEHKNRKLGETEERKSKLVGNHDQLQYHIDTIQQKLVRSEEANARLCDSAALLAALTKVTEERDMLLDYIQTNKAQTSDAAGRLVVVEAELAGVSHEAADLQRRNDHLQALLESQSSQNQMDHVYQTKTDTLTQTLDELQKDYNELQRKFDRKQLEAEELTKMQLSLLSQLKQRESIDRESSDEWLVMKSRNKELELNNVVLIDDNEALRLKHAKLVDEVEAMKNNAESSNANTNRLYTLEPECIALRSDKSQWLVEKAGLMEEITELRKLDDALVQINEVLRSSHPTTTGNGFKDSNDALNDDGDAANDTVNMGASIGFTNSPSSSFGASVSASPEAMCKSSSSSSSSSRFNKSPLSSSGNVVGMTNQLEIKLLSHNHATWTSAPALRSLSPELAARISSLYKDLLTQEERNIQVTHAVVSTRVELEALQVQTNAEMGRLLPKEAEMNQLIDEYRHRKEESAEEVMKNASARTSLDQIRMILKSTPGGVADLLPAVLGGDGWKSQSESARTTPSRGSGNGNSTSLQGNNRLNASDLHRSPAYNNNTHPHSHGQSLSQSHGHGHNHVTSSLIDNLRLVSAGAIHGSPRASRGAGSGIGKHQQHHNQHHSNHNLQHEEHEYDISDVDDQHIPDLISRIITRNANCVSGLQECLVLYDRLFADFSTLQKEHTAVVDEKENLQRVIVDIKEHQQKQEEGHNLKDQSLVQELNGATELVEKQNALIITLEAKITNIKRDKQLRNAQVFTFIQREEHARLLLWSLLEQFMTKLDLISSIRLPTKTIKLTGKPPAFDHC